MDNSMEQRFVDRLLHALAAVGEYDPVQKTPAPTPLPVPSLHSAPVKSPISH